MDRDFILKQFEKKKVYYKIEKGHAKIRCPNPSHDDRSPSCNVLLDTRVTSKATYPPGTFNCWSCGFSGGYNKLAHYLGLKVLTKKDVLERDPFFALGLTLDKLNEEEKPLVRPRDLPPWPVDKDFRGMPGKYLSKIGAKYWFDSISEVYRLYLEIFDEDDIVGYTAAALDKKVLPKYRNSEGEWATEYWLGEDYERNPYLKDIWARYGNKVAVIVEGPADWLRCTYYRIPTLAILGNNITKEKCSKVLGLGVERVVSFTDGDSAGRKYANKLNLYFRQYAKTNRYRLPDGYDPDNAPLKHIKAVKEMIEQWRI